MTYELSREVAEIVSAYVVGWIVTYQIAALHYNYVLRFYKWEGRFGHHNKKCPTRRWLIKYGYSMSPDFDRLAWVFCSFLWPVSCPIIIIAYLMIHCLDPLTPPPCSCGAVVAEEVV